MTDTAGRYIGARVERREDPRLLAGRGRYVDDITIAGLSHAAFVRSPYAHATIGAIDTSAAEQVPGVVGVLVAADLDASRDVDATVNIGIGPAPIASPLAATTVDFVGDPVAMVVADSRAIAEDAASLVDVEYEPLDARVTADDCGPDDIVELPAALAARLGGDGMPADAPPEILDAHHVVTETIHQQRYLPVPMEPRGIVADWQPQERRLTVWSSTQGGHRVREHIAIALGLAESAVRVIVGDVGGGFGQKLFVSREEVAVAVASRHLGLPVKWIEDRWENLTSASHAREEQALVTMAFDADARLVGIHTEHTTNVGAAGMPNLGMARLVGGPYRVPIVSGTSTSVRTNTSSRGAYRGPWMFETVARETMLDIAARRIGIDPLELRRRNVIQQSDLPYQSKMGVYTDVTPAETLDQAASMLGYEDFRADQELARADGRYLGVGIANFMEHTALAVGSGATDAVTLRVDASGTVQLVTGVNSQGHSVATTMSQVVAQELGVDIDDIVFINGDTDATPLGASTGGSRNAVYGGGAARAASIELRQRVTELAAHVLEAAPDDIVVSEGRASVRGTPAASRSLGELARISLLTPGALPDGIRPGLEVATRFHAGPGFTWSNATHICTCEVDVETGQIELLRYIVSEDCGTMINPMVVEGQISGGVVQGIGGALLEDFKYDSDGNPLTTTFMDYLLPTATEIPTIEFGHIETPSSRPGGFKGMGEGGAIGAPAAVINAVADALAPFGVVLTRQPLTPERVLDAIRTGRT